ncbi:putative RNA-binding protein 19, partial [Sciurus carolinensis]|nr:putative RNA-binding protein 19 [Sciurus carolinensis]
GRYIKVFREKHVPTAKGFPEHALKAYTAVDGQVFQGRMLHVLPSAIRKEASEDADTPSSSCKKKAVSKDKASSSSLAVRVAPGETQLVQEVQRFLLHNGVSLDSFSQVTAERSKTMILAKNLPAGTLAAELRETFGHFGSQGRVLLPKGGVTAIIVEFLEPLEVCRAF